MHQWFYESYMLLNAGKCLFVCLVNNTENETFLFKNIPMENSKVQKNVSVIIDNKLNFKFFLTASFLFHKKFSKIDFWAYLGHILILEPKNLQVSDIS